MYKRFGIGGFARIVELFHNLFVARKLDVAAKQEIGKPKKRIEPVDR